MSSARSFPHAATAPPAALAHPLRSILALADFSPKSDNAVARAALLAREHGASLHLLHVVAPRRFAAAALRRPARDALEVGLEQAELALAALAVRTARLHGVSATCTVRTGDTLQEVLEAARGADLVVVPAKRLNPLRDFVLRAPTERLLRMLQRPLLIVKRPALVPYAAMLAAAADASRGGSVAHTELAPGAGAADEFLVVSKDGQAAMGTFLLGRRAQRLVAHAACDVLLLPKAAGLMNREQKPERGRGAAVAIGAPSRVRPRTA